MFLFFFFLNIYERERFFKPFFCTLFLSAGGKCFCLQREDHTVHSQSLQSTLRNGQMDELQC